MKAMKAMKTAKAMKAMKAMKKKKKPSRHWVPARSTPCWVWRGPMAGAWLRVYWPWPKKKPEAGHEGDEGHVSELAKSDWCMGLAPGCGRVRSVVERKPEDAADSLSLRTNSRCMPTDLSKNK